MRPCHEPETAGPPLRTHGGPLEAELRALGVTASELLDFSTSCNPYGPSPEVRQAVLSAPLERYPDPSASAARGAIAAALQVSAGEIALGNGAAELLWTLARSLVRPATRVLIVEPTFSEFGAACRCAGAQVHEWRARADDGFALDLDAVLEAARRCEAALIYLCAPNTPTGTALPAPELASAAAAHPELRFILDQSFLSLSDRWDDARIALPANVVRVCSLTKEQGIPGVRVGYLLAESSLVARIERERPAWTTSAHAQAAAVAACANPGFVAQSRERLLRARIRLSQGLLGLGLPAVPSSAGFLLVPARDAASLRVRLLHRERILIRDCSSFGLPHHIRLAARPDPDCDRLLAALARELAC